MILPHDEASFDSFSTTEASEHGGVLSWNRQLP